MYQIYRLQWLTCKRYMLPLLHKEFVLISWIFHNFCPTNCFGAHAVNPNVNFHYEQMLSKKVICATTCAPPSGRCCGCGMRGIRFFHMKVYVKVGTIQRFFSQVDTTYDESNSICRCLPISLASPLSVPPLFLLLLDTGAVSPART